jgi:threonine dehydrogenase-like Zn-dependent dehydrogenase
MLLDLAGQRGTMICIGLTGGAQIPISMDRVALKELDAYSVRANSNSYDEVVTLLRKGKVDFKPLDNSYVSLDGP